MLLYCVLCLVYRCSIYAMLSLSPSLPSWDLLSHWPCCSSPPPEQVQPWLYGYGDNLFPQDCLFGTGVTYEMVSNIPKVKSLSYLQHRNKIFPFRIIQFINAMVVSRDGQTM